MMKRNKNGVSPLSNIQKKIIQKIIGKVPWLRSRFYFTHTEEGIRLQSMLIHKNIKGYPTVEGTVTKDITPTKQDIILTKRLLNAYKKAMFNEKNEKSVSGEDIWSTLGTGSHAEFINLLRGEDIEAIAFSLCNMTRLKVSEGLVQGASEYERLLADPLYRQWLALFNLDKLITLAEALGVLPCENPEQGEFCSAIFSDIDEIVEKIEQHLHISIIPPLIEGGLYKLLTKKGGIHNRDITAVYTAWRCKGLLKVKQNPHVCEIGAGVGKAAYYAYLLGIHRYTIIDLPHVNVLQGFYLIKCLPSANIILYGENRNEKESFISILPDWSMKQANGKPFNLTLNQDSFPEIHRDIVTDYLKQIRLHTKDYFLSINQESQNTMVGNEKQHVVSELVLATKGFEQLSRFPYWMRVGYLEELYGITDKK